MLEHIITLQDEDWETFHREIVANDLYIELPLRTISRLYGKSPATLHRYAKALAQHYNIIQACTKTRKTTKTQHKYYINLRHELILTAYARLLPEIDPQQGPRATCALLPYIARSPTPALAHLPSQIHNMH